MPGTSWPAPWALSSFGRGGLFFWLSARSSAVDRRQIELAETLGIGQDVHLDDLSSPDARGRHSPLPRPELRQLPIRARRGPVTRAGTGRAGPRSRHHSTAVPGPVRENPAETPSPPFGPAHSAVRRAPQVVLSGEAAVPCHGILRPMKPRVLWRVVGDSVRPRNWRCSNRS